MKNYTLLSGAEAKQMFAQDPELFDVVSNFSFFIPVSITKASNFKLKNGPVNPVDVLIEYLKSQSKDLIIADFGCGRC